LYTGAKIENILVTNGSSESNFIFIWSSIEPEDEVIFTMPNYMQIWGLLRCFGAKVKLFYLKENLAWAPDLEELKKLVTDKTKLIIITNPNNPTGAVLSEEEMEEIINLADKVGAMILADEVYRGAELNGEITPSFWGRYDKVAVVGGLSKAFGLPGLRIGWIVSSKDLIEKLWHYHDYITIAPSTLSDWLARIALSPNIREKIIQRNRKILRKNLSILISWFEKHNDIFHCIPPKAGAIAF
ncbi:aminotransferase class I/II-fold pyridoxal phosphate-dependent enzyme, partial [SCandidatus Aminicenantes bacterium Aminicenantia_JdfR_composite]|nr:aminotransferase class I/II-fold pyridoxal phosphate-dependent enzyme [SCandidatus Aminicenantes bacterium Aminicenantia_JdfR_composite]